MRTRLWWTTGYPSRFGMTLLTATLTLLRRGAPGSGCQRSSSPPPNNRPCER
jgi:hypothetical protein